jgi:4-amino-4-deoxy-L-arabinose transferase-like glycosyltransferase
MSKRQATLTLILVTLLALGLRLWRLDEVPPGLWWDEGHHDQRALDILQGGARPIYFAESEGFEPLHIYLTALLFRLFGVHYLATRWVSALAGALTVPALYWAAVEWLSDPLGEARARRIGLLAALNLSIIFPHILINRIGFEMALVPLGTTLMLAGLGRGMHIKRGAPLIHAGWFALSGLILGITLYTYPAARVSPLIVIAWGVILLLFDRPTLRQTWPLLALLTSVSILTYAPLGWYFLRHPEWFFGRISYVSAGARSGWMSLLLGVWKTALGVLIRGDMHPRHNLPGRPFLDPLLGMLFIAGLGILARRTRRRTSDAKPLLLILLWMLIGLAPSALSDGAPTFTRGLGAAPPIALLVALGAEWLWRLGRRRYGRLLPTALLALALMVSASLTLHDLFIRYPARPEMFEAYQVGLWETLEEARQAGDEGKTYLSPVAPDLFHPTVDFVLRTTPGIQPYDGRTCQVFPHRTTEQTTFALLLLDDRASLERLQAIYPDGFVARQILHEPEPYPFAAIFHVPPGTEARIPGAPAGVRFGEGVEEVVELATYHYQMNDDTLDLTLYWRSLAPVSINYTVFVHLQAHQTNETKQQALAGQHDGWPCDGGYPTTRWRPGEVVMDRRRIALSPTAEQQASSYTLYVGLYDLDTMQRLPITAAPPPVVPIDERARVTVIEHSP